MKILKKIILLIFIILIGAVGILFFYVKSTLPEKEGEIIVPSLKSKVNITINKWGIPKIETDNLDDIVFSIGYIHAADRMFQMDLARRYAEGRLSEIVGKKGLNSDIRHKKLFIEESIESVIKNLNPEYYNLLKRYSEGVNWYLEHNKLPIEFKILGYKPEKWSVKDSVAIFKNLELYLQSSGGELYNYKIIKAVGKERAEKLLSTYFGSTIINDKEYSELFYNKQLEQFFKNEENIRDGKIGSNNWVISGRKTKSGKPILANDPHLPVSFPSQFYQLFATDGKHIFSGNTLPGVPLIIIGRNKNIGWGFTNIGTDVIDYFILKINPANKNQYFFNGEWKNFKIINKRIKIKGKRDFVFKIKVSELGPVYEESGIIMARHDLGLYPSNTIEAFFKMNMATNINEFVKGLSKFTSPAQNCVFADTKGNIGYYPTGLVPIRGKGDGSVPIVVKKSSDVWQGFYKEWKKPIIINPEKGFIATANNPVIPETKIPIFTKEYDLSFRADRIKELLEKENKFTVEKVKKIQTDCLTKSGEFLIGKIKNLKFNDKDANFILDKLKGWNFRLDKGISPYLFYNFEKLLAKNIFGDEFTGEYRRLISRRWIYKIMDYPLKDIKDKKIFNYWIDDNNTPETETFKEVVLKTLIELYDMYRNDMRKLKLDWDKIHTIYYKHPLGSISVFKPFFNRGPYSIKGGRDTILRSDFKGNNMFGVDMSSTFRMILDFKDFSKSVIVNSAGESGNFISNNYDDQIKLFVNLKYRKMEDFRGKKLILKPE